MRFASWPLLNLTTQMMQLGLEAQEVMTLRMGRLLAGGPAAQHEASRMVAEKVDAMLETQRIMVSAALCGQTGLGSRNVVGLYRRKVRSNRRRLSK